MLTNRTTPEFYEKYRAITERVGINLLAPLVPATEERLAYAFREDPRLNNLPLRLFDTRHALVKLLLRQAQIFPAGGWASMETVCLLKHVAIYVILGARPDFTEDEKAS